MTVPLPGPPRRPAGPGPEDAGPADAGPGGHADPQDAVARAMEGLDGLADRPLAEHVEAFERVHAALSDALATPTGPA